jgi:diguanylate cyclase (GGDEF)-like protein
MNFEKFKFTPLQLIIAIIGFFIIAVVYVFNDYAKNYLIKVNKTNSLVLRIEKEDYNINYEVLKNSFFLYSSFDETIEAVKRIKRNINLLKKELTGFVPDMLKNFKEYENEINKKIDYIYEFQKENAPIKNSTIFLANLLSKIYDYDFSPEYTKKAINAISSVYLAKFTNDTSLVKLDLDYFKHLKFSGKKDIFNKSLILNLNVVKNNLKNYNFYLNQILTSSSLKKLKTFKHMFFNITTSTINTFVLVGYAGIALLILVVIFFIFLIGIVEKDKDIFKELAYIDPVTGLYNANKYLLDEKNFDVILLLNIEKFRNINNLYGRDVGDKVLKTVANYLRKLNLNVYRINADNFSILLNNKKEAMEYLNKIFKHFENNFYEINENLKIQISFNAALSSVKPLLKTAEIAIYYIKKNKRIRFIEYNEKLDNSYEIKENIKKSIVLNYAIKNNKIIPYFQPIVEIKTGKIVKYEVLARIENNGKIESIFPYLEIAKENKVYKEITKAIISKSFEIFYKKNIAFSVNLSIDDILDVDIINFLRKKLKEYKGIEKYLTFEILEGEAIKDYHRIEKFVKLMKKRDIKFAIDDFGSGYSNFAHVMNLDIDFIKIDGSLIKNIDRDKVSKEIVELLSLFAKKENIKTIAEFVHNETVFEIVKKIGIDCAQGFYLYEPLPFPIFEK